MTKAYLLLNAGMYALFAIWCTVAPDRTSAALGFSFRSGSGRSEYLTIYGGLQLGLAVFFLLAGLRRELEPAGILFAAAFYLGIVLFRMASFATVAGIERTTYMIAGLELVLALGALALLLRMKAPGIAT